MHIHTPEIITRESKYPRRDIWILLAVSGALRLAFLGINQAEYTDGILQVQQFTEPVGIWPPLYTALVYPFKFIFGYLWAGRLVSAVASTFAIYPLYKMARRAFGTRAALYAGIFYLTAPVANRWGIRMMTESTFCLFFWWACERLCFSSDERDKWRAWSSYGFAALFTVLASLTRYQGLLLLGPLGAVAVILWKRFGAIPWKPSLWLLGLAVMPLWIHLAEARATFIHIKQFQDRALDESKMELWKVLAYNGEAFIAYFPYFLTYPVGIISAMGMFTTRMRRGPFIGWLMLYVAAVLLVAQSAFSSFQERYFLPLMGFFWILAGSGLHAIQERWHRPARDIRRRLFIYVMIGTYVYSAAWSVVVLLGQRESFGDIASASRWVGREAPQEAMIFTNDVYRPQDANPSGGRKVAFFAKRPVKYLNENYIPTSLNAPSTRIPDGSIIVLSDIYGGSLYYEYLSQHYRLKELKQFTASVLPLLPENMAVDSRFGSQNPLTWFDRYEWQRFQTSVHLVEGSR